jgi:hypothetical protein
MNLRKQVQTFAMAGMLALSVVVVPAVAAHAELYKGRIDDPGIELGCLNKSTGKWTESGDVTTVKTHDGKEHTVGCYDGTWHEVRPT